MPTICQMLRLIVLLVPAIVLGRDFVIVMGAGVYKLLYEEVEIAPTFLSKANTAMQIVVTLLMTIALLPFGAVSAMCQAVVDPYAFLILALLGLGSGFDYVVTWGSKAYRESKRRKAYKRGPRSLRGGV